MSDDRKQCGECRETLPVTEFRFRRYMASDLSERISYRRACRACERVADQKFKRKVRNEHLQAVVAPPFDPMGCVPAINPAPLRWIA